MQPEQVSFLPEEPSSFKKPEELGLTNEQFCSLVKVMEGLQNGTLVHLERNKWDDKNVPPNASVFNMSTWKDMNCGCGTVCCIGGWAEVLGGFKFATLNNIAQSRPVLNSLFRPPDRDSWDNITEKQAARAIGNYLTTGDPQWGKARKEP